MAIYTITETGYDADGIVQHRVDCDGAVLADALDFQAARSVVVHAIQSGDLYQESNGREVYARLTLIELYIELYREAAFVRRAV